MNLLFSADLHLRGEIPRCRTDANWLESQRKDIAFLVDTAIKHDAILILVGDLFHTPRTATEVVNMLISELQRLPEGQVQILAGNHDLPYHSYAHLEQSSIGTVLKSFPELVTEKGKWDAYPFGLDEEGEAPVRFVHRLVFPDQTDLAKLAGASTAEDMTKEFPKNRTIVCGDYHHSFDKEFPETDQLVLNPGCMNIQAADMIGYQPKCILAEWEELTGIASHKWIDIPQPEEAFTSSEYLEAEKARDDRLEAFMETVQASGEVSLSFQDNLEARSKKASKQVQSIITEMIQEVSNESK